MMIKNNKESYTLWQTNSEGVPEQAILFSLYNDVFEMKVGKSDLIINYETINELVKTLRLIQKLKR